MQGILYLILKFHLSFFCQVPIERKSCFHHEDHPGHLLPRPQVQSVFFSPGACWTKKLPPSWRSFRTSSASSSSFAPSSQARLGAKILAQGRLLTPTLQPWWHPTRPSGNTSSFSSKVCWHKSEYVQVWLQCDELSVQCLKIQVQNFFQSNKLLCFSFSHCCFPLLWTPFRYMFRLGL